MRDFMKGIGSAIRVGWVSFRDSMRALVDQRIDADDMRGLMWIAAIALVIVLVGMALRAQERRIMK
jgi:TRAP-type C4-dicarboxylate transport system permease small subunit